MFLAATLLLHEDQIVQFDDVPYLHQHLVANLPAEPPPDVPARSGALPTNRPLGASGKAAEGSDHEAGGSGQAFGGSEVEAGVSGHEVGGSVHEAASSDAMLTHEASGRPAAALESAASSKPEAVGRVAAGASVDATGRAVPVETSCLAGEDGAPPVAVLLVGTLSHAEVAARLLRAWRARAPPACPPLPLHVWSFRPLVPSGLGDGPAPHSTRAAGEGREDGVARAVDLLLDELESSKHIRRWSRRVIAVIPQPLPSPGQPSAATAAAAALLHRLGELLGELSVSRTPFQALSGTPEAPREAEPAGSIPAGGPGQPMDRFDLKRGQGGAGAATGDSCGAARGRLVVLLCVDPADGDTMTAALAARLLGLCVVNVCDDTLLGVRDGVGGGGADGAQQGGGAHGEEEDNLAAAEAEAGRGLEPLLGLRKGSHWAFTTLDLQMCHGA